MKLKIVVVFVALFGLSCAEKNENKNNNPEDDIIPPPSYYSKLEGIFSSAGSLDENVMSQEHLDGVLIRVQWKDLEVTPDNYNWELIDAQLELVNKYEKKWSLAILAGSFSPDWLYSSFNVKSMNLEFRGDPVKVPLVDDVNLGVRFKRLMDRVGERYSEDLSLALVYLPQMTLNGVEGHFNGNSSQTLLEEGFSEEKWISFSLEFLYYLKESFPLKKVAIELHEVLGSEVVVQAITDDIVLKGFTENVGVAIWWLSGKTSYQEKVLGVIKRFSDADGQVFSQLIGSSATPERFYHEDFREAFAQAEYLGIKYIEVWNFDIVKEEWNEVFDEFK